MKKTYSIKFSSLWKSKDKQVFISRDQLKELNELFFDNSVTGVTFYLGESLT